MSIIWSDPLNRAHPLNRGLFGWWLVMPHAKGGTTLRDLAGTRHGTLTSMDPATDWVAAGDRRSGWGALDFDGSNDFVDMGILTPWDAATNATMSGWMYRPSTGTTVGFGQWDNPYRVTVVWFSDDVVYFSVQNGASSFPNFSKAQSGWHHVCMTYDGSQAAWARLVTYWDGVDTTFSTGGTNPPASLPTSPNQPSFRLGMDDNNGNRFWAGRIDDVRTYDRTLKAVEVQQLFELSRTGYGGLLNRQRRVFKAPGVTGFIPFPRPRGLRAGMGELVGGMH